MLDIIQRDSDSQQLYQGVNGFAMLAVILGLSAVLALAGNAVEQAYQQAILWLLAFSTLAIGALGFFVLEQNQSVVALFFGRYVGTFRGEGFWWRNPLYRLYRISLRLITTTTPVTKINDKKGNPVITALYAQWRILQPEKVVLNVAGGAAVIESYVSEVLTAVMRQVVANHPYDQDEEGSISLRGHPDKISDNLLELANQRLEDAGVVLLQAQLTELSYAPEIASDMLRVQQAEAVLRAKQKLAEGVFALTEEISQKLERSDHIDGDASRNLARDLMVIMLGETGLQPVVNVGSRGR